MRLFAIDPGETESAWVDFDTKSLGAVDFKTESNLELRARIRAMAESGSPAHDAALIEVVTGYGKSVGRETFTTCEWIGRFSQDIEDRWKRTFLERWPRREVKRILCEEVGASDADVRAACIDILGGKAIAIGKKTAPGPLHGMKGDEWQALAIALAWVERRRWELELEKKTAAFAP